MFKSPVLIVNCLLFVLQVSAKCKRATNELVASNDSCAQAFVTIPDNVNDRISFEQADRALDAVCGTTGCRNRVINFADSCLSVSVYMKCSSKVTMLELTKFWQGNLRKFNNNIF